MDASSGGGGCQGGKARNVAGGREAATRSVLSAGLGLEGRGGCRPQHRHVPS
jgi:hypothetical protein